MHPLSPIQGASQRLGRHAGGTPVGRLFSAHRQTICATKLIAEKEQLREVEIVCQLEDRVRGGRNEDAVLERQEEPAPLPVVGMLESCCGAPGRTVDEDLQGKGEFGQRRREGQGLSFYRTARTESVDADRARRVRRRPIVAAPVLKCRGMSQVDCHAQRISTGAGWLTEFLRKADGVLARF